MKIFLTVGGQTIAIELSSNETAKASTKSRLTKRGIALARLLTAVTLVGAATTYGVLQNDYQPLLALLDAATSFLLSAADHLKQKTV